MAERRMFHAGVVESDGFLDLSPAAQALYFHLGMQADDDGFVNGPRQVCRRCGARMEELQELMDGGFLLWFDGIAVVKHFRMANTLQNDRIKQLNYPEIAKQIYLSPNRIYTTEVGKRKENLYFSRMAKLKKVGIRPESKRNPRGKEEKGTEPNRKEEKGTEPNRKEKKRTEPKPIIIGSTEEANRLMDTVGADAHIRPGSKWSSTPTPPATTYADDGEEDTILLQEERDGVVQLTHGQIYNLLAVLGLDTARYYVQKLAKFIKEHNANIKDHYATVMKWWQEDGGTYHE